MFSYTSDASVLIAFRFLSQLLGTKFIYLFYFTLDLCSRTGCILVLVHKSSSIYEMA